jgi:hypothetical protein
MQRLWIPVLSALAALALTAAFQGLALAQQKQPNILVIWATTSAKPISAPPPSVMGYRTPNIDRIATEGMIAPINQKVPPS